ncbi:MAG: hypothetical protein WCS37_04420 [Chloroflexota bacterium]
MKNTKYFSVLLLIITTVKLDGSDRQELCSITDHVGLHLVR